MQQEETLGKAYDSRLMRRLLRYLKPYRWHVTLGILFSLVVSASEALRPIFTKIAVDKNIATHDKKGLLVTISLFLALIFIRGLIQYANAYLTQWIGQRTIYDIRMEIYEKLQKLSVRFYDKTPTGRLITRLTNDVEVLNEMFSSGIVMFFSDIFTILGIIFFMFVMDWRLSIVSLSVLPLLFYGTFLFRRKAREAYRIVRTQLARINSFMQEHISGMLVNQLYTREQLAYQEFKEINAGHRDANIKSILYYAIFYPSVDLIYAIAVGLIIWYAGYNALQGLVTVGTVIAFVQFNEMFWRPIRDLSEKYNILQTAMASSERIFQLIDNTDVQPEPIFQQNFNNIKGQIEFRKVWFTYNTANEDPNTSQWVLKNISFKIDPGHTVAIVGYTGAGKTTIVNLLIKFYEIQKGEILIDGINIQNINMQELRRLIGIVPQDVFIFSDTVYNNISLGNSAISKDKIEEIAHSLGLSRFIEALPQSYNTYLKECGSSLSVGQKQLIAFARALAFDPKILILDEATSSIDTETEQLIQQAIRNILKGRTSIVIAHRLSTIQHANKIIVIHKGEIREEGTHQELLKLKGIYRKLYELQYRDQEIKSHKIGKTNPL